MTSGIERRIIRRERRIKAYGHEIASITSKLETIRKDKDYRERLNRRKSQLMKKLRTQEQRRDPPEMREMAA